jgi:hypothetical protein
MDMVAHRLLLLCGGVLLPLSTKEWADLTGTSHAGRIDDRKDCIARNRLTNKSTAVLTTGKTASHGIDSRTTIEYR